jgi:peptide/nickel transport system permease protein
MAIESIPITEPQAAKKNWASSAFVRVARYSLVRLATLFVTMAIATYLTILIANMGGYVDEIMRSEIRERITQQFMSNPASLNMDTEVRKKLINDSIALEERRIGLDTPFVIRSFRYLFNALKLDLGRAINLTSDSGSKNIRLIILERLPATLLLMGSSQLLLFFGSVYIALILSRNYGNFWDKLVITLSPTSAAPPWFYGIFFILIFAAVLKVLPFGGMVDSPPPDSKFDYTLSVLKHLILPGSALVISALFLSIYNWRTFFLIYSSEDYVEMARAKGLHPQIYPAPHPAKHHHQLCPAHHRPVDGCHRHRDRLPVARPRTHLLPRHRPVRYARHRGPHHHLRLPARHDRFPARFHLRPR